jgi:hypothetical protein
LIINLSTKGDLEKENKATLVMQVDGKQDKNKH